MSSHYDLRGSSLLRGSFITVYIIFSLLDGSDFTAQSVDLVFVPGGATIVCTNIPITDDQISEPSAEETFDVTIELPPSGLTVELGQNPVSTVTIVDDDGKNIVYVATIHNYVPLQVATLYLNNYEYVCTKNVMWSH